MPTISVDTFFACSLMVILVLSAMAGASRLLSQFSNAVDVNFAGRYEETSKYLLLNEGTPSNWGQNGQIIPETFGLATYNSDNPYELDMDKVSRLNSENLYALSYAQIFTALKMPDTSFRIEIKPLFDVSIDLTATFDGESETVYQFGILTEKQGVLIQTFLKEYVIAENYFEATGVLASDGNFNVNVTLSHNTGGPALFVVFAKAAYDDAVVSFDAYSFAHNSAEPEPEGTFLKLSPLNYFLNASLVCPETSLSNVYALTFNYNSTMTQASSNNESVTFDIPHFLGASPTLTVATGYNSTTFFVEYAAYPQIPLQIGADFASSNALSSIFTYTYIVTMQSVLYECTVWIGGPKG